MEDRVLPSAKHNHQPTTGLPATKAQFYNRPGYSPQPPSKRPRSVFRACFRSFLLLILFFVVLASIACGILYAVYRPHRPSFSVSSIRLSSLNISSADRLNSRLDLTVAARNSNRKIVFLYDQISVSITSNAVGIGNGSFPAFSHAAKNTTVLRSTVLSTGQSVDQSTAADLKKSSIPLEIEMETKTGIRMGRLKTTKIRIKVLCGGIEMATPNRKTPSPELSSATDCKVKLTMKIWKWTI